MAVRLFTSITASRTVTCLFAYLVCLFTFLVFSMSSSFLALARFATGPLELCHVYNTHMDHLCSFDNISCLGSPFLLHLSKYFISSYFDTHFLDTHLIFPFTYTTINFHPTMPFYLYCPRQWGLFTFDTLCMIAIVLPS